MDLSVELTDSQKTILKQVYNFYHFILCLYYLVVLTTLKSFVSQQFREVVKDLQLTNSEDAFLARWLIGKLHGDIICICWVHVS
jgi:hypothetical protein